METIRVAVFGYGHLGKWHCQKAHLLDESELALIVEPHVEHAKKAKETYPDIPVVDDV